MRFKVFLVRMPLASQTLSLSPQGCLLEQEPKPQNLKPNEVDLLTIRNSHKCKGNGKKCKVYVSE